MTWELVKQVIESINTSRETAIKIGTENAHEDYMFVTETRMAVGEEVIEEWEQEFERDKYRICLLYTSPSPRDGLLSRMPSSA